MPRPRVQGLTVLKLGGSLARSRHLAAWLAAAAACPQALIVVPGGGPFADQVRALQAHWRFDDGLAHHLAIEAMAQFGRLLTGMGRNLVPAESLRAIRRARAAGATPVWLPARMTIGRPEIAESWEVTSDSLAAWLAGRLRARRLVLVKARRPARPAAALDELVGEGLIDPAFPRFLPGAGCRAWCLAAEESARLEGLLAAGAGGTEILTAQS